MPDRVLFQDPVVDRPLTGRRNLEIHARLWGVPVRQIAGRLEEGFRAVVRGQ
jgi:ABC-type multidrug transport system ATPase subunit